MRRVVQTIALTPTEKRLFALLVDVAKRRSPGTTVRVAGGWVRDKLLGLPGRDIDIVLDDTSGARFAKHVVAHQRAAASRGGRGKRKSIDNESAPGKHSRPWRGYSYGPIELWPT